MDTGLAGMADVDKAYLPELLVGERLKSFPMGSDLARNPMN
jgi:hypothetical protein